MLYSDPILIQLLQTKKRNDLISLSCHVCGTSFTRRKKEVQDSYRKGIQYVCCSSLCGARSNSLNNIKTTCLTCQKEITKRPCDIKDTKYNRTFCSSSCAAKYNNTHKTTGNRRSRLEQWLEQQLKETYPTLAIEFNQKTKINSELDIYIPILNLAFELNGIFHYEPIYGKEKLAQIQSNDTRKFQACLEQNIELCIINTCNQKRVNPKTSAKYLKIITDIIESKL